ncbi:MAG: right-handed parallel beta-helix repeat-containing protein, partial [Planctomycetota bacterium]
TDNSAYSGAGLYFDPNCEGSVTNSTLVGNTARGDGGGIRMTDCNEMHIADCNIFSNGAARGAGICAIDSPEATIIGCQIRSNEAVRVITTVQYFNPDPNDPNLPGEPVDEDDPNFDPNDPNLIQIESHDSTGAARGGGIFSFKGPGLIADCQIGENTATTAGGGLYLSGDPNFAEDVVENTVRNCLIVENTAGTYGGGVSANWYIDLMIANCTIADNQLFEGWSAGGGLHCSYRSNVDVVDCIIWDNFSPHEGAQVAVGSGDPAHPLPSVVNISYSDIGPPYDPNRKPEFDPGDTGVAWHSTPASGAVLADGQTIYDKFDAGQEKVNVIVSLHEPTETRATTNWASPASVDLLRGTIAGLQSSVLDTLTPAEFTLGYLYQNQAGFSGRVTIDGLNKLLSNHFVAHVEPVRHLKKAMAQGIPLANASAVRQVYDGVGAAVAIVDTGVDYTHPMLGGGGFPNAKVIGGYDHGEGDADPMPLPGDAASNTAHGTCCAGVAAGGLGVVGDYIGGVAPGAKIYALKISDANYTLLTDAAVAAWDWCVTHAEDDPANPIKVISNSWGTFVVYNDPGQAEADFPALTTAANTATAAGLTVLAASHNWSSLDGISAPAAFSNVVSVGAVHDAAFYSRNCFMQVQPDMVTCYSNTDEILDILAPADLLFTTDMVGPDGYDGEDSLDNEDYFAEYSGTSAATPFAAGCVAVIQSANRARFGTYLQPADVRTLLIESGDSVTDWRIDITKPRVNLGMAIGTVSYAPPIYVERDCVLNGWQAPDSNSYWGWDANLWDANVIEEDPNFVSGYYLGQFAAGQTVESNCVNGGSDDAGNLGMDVYTTRTDGVFDNGRVDMGYHYSEGVPTYELIVTVQEDPCDPGIHGSVEPNSGLYYAGTVLTLKPTAEQGYYVRGWYDDNGALISLSRDLEVTMNSNKRYSVLFGRPERVEISGGGDALRSAVAEARNGDSLVVFPGVYDGGINFDGKDVKLYSSKPDDPCTVAQTIIDCDYSSGGFYFSGGEGPEAVLDGFTIINGWGLNQSGGGIYIASDSSPTIVNLVISDCVVVGASGGGIYIGADSSPTFGNVSVTYCAVWGGNGAAVYVGANSRPEFRDCVFSYNFAVGGSGGAVYCAHASWPAFVGCTFSYNLAAGSGGAVYHDAKSSSTFDRCEFSQNGAGSNGGGVYYGPAGSSELAQCTFAGNVAGLYGGGSYYAYDSTFAADMSGGAMFYGQGSSLDINGSSFTNNLSAYGGGLYFAPDCLGTVANSSLSGNEADEDGGAIYMEGCDELSVEDCDISGNQAVRGGGLWCMDSPGATIVGCTINDNEAVRITIWYTYLIPDPDWEEDPNDPNAEPPLILIEPDDPNFDPNDANMQRIPHVDDTGAAQGGGIFSFAGPLSIKDCNVSHNRARTSGGGMYLAGDHDPLSDIGPEVKSCLITHNTAGNDGGGLSCNWYIEARISNCTIVNNRLNQLPGYGGGLYCSYGSDVEVIDCILWNNTSTFDGREIAVGSGDPYDPLPSTVKVTYSDIDNRAAEGDADEQQWQPVDADALPVIRPAFNNWTLPRNDDGYTGYVPTGFGMDFFGTGYSGLFVNNNGNVTFNHGMSTWVPFGLTGNIGTAIIAPFFADVDTSPGSGYSGNPVTYGIGTVDGHAAFGVNWVDVGYFPSRFDRLNSFQLVLVDRSDREPGDFDIEFNYAQIQWESNGDGLGPPSAHVGFSNGTGQAGTFYEFAGSGIPGSFLDTNLQTGLIYGSRNSNVSGRYIFSVRGGYIATVAGDPIYVEPECTVEGWDPIDPEDPWDADTHNFSADPNFTHGYYLSHIDAGQDFDSPCIDVGSDTAVNVEMHTHTTRIDGVKDVPDSNVDVGYHYRDGLPRYDLTVTVVEDANGQTHGTVGEPQGAEHVDHNSTTGTYTYYEGAVLTLTAHPDTTNGACGYRVKEWTDTDDDSSTDTRNTATMTRDRHVTVEFEQIPVRELTVTVRNGNGL